jgi:CheY-like chemotaxis protein
MRTILVAEDSKFIRLDLTWRLEKAGYTVVAADDADDAVAAAGRHGPSLVFMDIRLPGQGGIEAACAIRRDFGIPVIFISAYVDRATREAAAAARPAGFIEKPFAGIDFRAVIEEALGGEDG